MKNTQAKTRSQDNKEYRKEWQRKKRARMHRDNPDAIECLICGSKYIQVGSHIVQRHGMTARKYREKFGLDVKRGLTKGEFRKRKAKAVFDNGTVENLKKGKKYWFKSGQKNVGKYSRSEQTLKRLKKHIKK
jgi:predicted transcriptional regulator